MMFVPTNFLCILSCNIINQLSSVLHGGVSTLPSNQILHKLPLQLKHMFFRSILSYTVTFRVLLLPRILTCIF